MKALVVGFESEHTRRLSAELRAAGHHVLGAVGKQGAWTFLRAIAPDVVVVPAGVDGERARGWVAELGVEVAFVDLPDGSDAARRLARFERGEPLDEPPPPPPPPEPEPEPVVVAPAPEPVVVAPEPELEPEPLFVAPEPVAAPAPSRRARRPAAADAPDDDPQARDPHPDLVSKLAQVRFGDYHSILEVEPGGSPYAVREQHDRLARRFSARGWPARLNPEEIDILDEIARGIADAHLILSDPELAARYERALAGAPTSPSTSAEVSRHGSPAPGHLPRRHPHP